MSLAVRPSFERELPLASTQAIARLSAQLAAGSQTLRRTRVPGGGRETTARDQDHLVLTVPATQQRFWSPWLTIELTPRGDGTHLFARFSPHPSVWTGFWFGYLALGLVLLFALVFTAALAMTGGSLWSLWIAGGATLAMAAMWWASRIGQRLAQEQMATLRAELERALADLGDGDDASDASDASDR